MKFVQTSLLLLCCSFLMACAGQQTRDPQDPWEGVNRGIYKFNDTLDKAILKPVAKGYDKVVPKPIDSGIDNFIGNIGDVIVFFNDLLQLKGRQAASDFTRVLTNSIMGLGGVLDVATPLGLPKHNEDFGQTLGYWGVPSGPYVVIPFMGPSTVRDGLSLFPDGAVSNEVLNNIGIDEFEERIAYSLIATVNIRQSLLGADEILEQSGAEPYIFLRESYLQRRRNLINDGAPPELEDAVDAAAEEEAIFGDEF